MARVQFGWLMPVRFPHDRAAFLEGLDRSLATIAGHFDSVWCADHIQFGDQQILEGWTLLTYVAARHPEFRVGHTVLCQSFRNPALVAKMAATLQYLTGGRYVLGIGAGWHEEEYRAYGYDFPRDRVRIEQMEEAVRVIKALWQEPPVTFAGPYYAVREAYCEPRPAPPPVLMIPGFKPRSIGVVARHADWWNTGWVGIAEFREQLALLEQSCAAAGRDPATIRRTWFGGCACAPTEAEAIALTEGRYTTETAFVGTPAQVIAQLRPFVEAGVDYFQFGFHGFPNLTTLELLAHEVLPALNE